MLRQVCSHVRIRTLADRVRLLQRGEGNMTRIVNVSGRATLWWEAAARMDDALKPVASKPVASTLASATQGVKPS